MQSRKRFGRWTVVGDAEKRAYYVIAVCDCGTRREVYWFHLKYGRSRSCGCLQAEDARRQFTTHGHTLYGKRSPTYKSWENMIQRCYNPDNARFDRYGGRGISVCKPWHTFSNFLADMGERPEGTIIGRINHDRGYSPSNCRWEGE